jgi:hypothetical protein
MRNLPCGCPAELEQLCQLDPLRMRGHMGVLARRWLVVKGFKPSPITAGMTPTDSAPALHDVTA